MVRAPEDLELRLEEHRRELTAYAYRMLGSGFEAEDAVQETMLRAWRGFEAFEGRAALLQFSDHLLPAVKASATDEASKSAVEPSGSIARTALSTSSGAPRGTTRRTV